MAEAGGCLVDTNVLLRLFRPDDREHLLVRAAVERLQQEDAQLYYAFQNVCEFWNVCTRPVDRNGLGLSAARVDAVLREIEGVMELLPESAEGYSRWRELVRTKDIRGVQVHDARLAAVMEASGVRRILTLNGKDFQRFEGIEVVEVGG